MENKCSTREIVDMITDVNLDVLLGSIRKKAATNDRDIPSAIKAMFYSSTAGEEESAKRRFEVFKFTISLLRAFDLSPQTSTELVSLLIGEVDVFQTSLLMEIANYFVLQVNDYSCVNIKWLEVLPKVLLALSTRDSIVYKGQDMSGIELKSSIIQSLCSSELKPECVIQLATVLNGVELTNDEIRQLTELMLHTLPQLKYQEMPSLVYQLLSFPAKSYRKYILQGVISYYIEEERKMLLSCSEDTDSDVIIQKPDSELFFQMEGTIILLIQVSCKQDIDLGKKFLLMLKSLQNMPSITLSSFTFSVALSLSCILRYEEQVLDILKNIVLNSFRQKEKCQQSLWMRDLLPEDTSIVEHLKVTIANSKHGWDHVSQGLVKFGFLLLDTFGLKTVCGKVQNLSKPHVLTIPEQCCALGSTILCKTFHTHPLIRSKVFEQILKRVITKSSCPVSQYIDVLSRTVQRDPQLLLEVLSKVMEILEYLTFLPYNNAAGILKALTPLLKISMPLKDTLMLILRKALFHRDMEPRKIAIYGYLTILKKISGVGKMSLSQSQCSASSQTSSSSLLSQHVDLFAENSSMRSKSICLEIMGILKRTLMQQAELKQLLYEGLHDVVLKNSSLADIVLELLLSQFEKYLNVTDDSKVPIEISLCTPLQKDKFVLIEPIAHLISSICLILHEVKHRLNVDEDLDLEFEQSAQVILEDKLKTLTAKVSEKEPEEFGINKAQDIDEPNAISKKELCFLLLGVYEVLMENSLMNNSSYTVEGCEEVLLLYKKHEKVLSMLQGKKGNKLSKKNQPINLPHSLVTIRFVARVIEALFNNDNLAHQDGLNVLRANNFFVKYILSICNEKLVLYSETGKSDGFSQNMESTYDHIYTISRVFLRSYSADLLTSFPSLEHSEVAFSFVDGLNLIFSYMFSGKAEMYQKFITDIAKQVPTASDNAVTRVVKKFQRLTIKALSDTEDNHLKEVLPLLSIIGYICTIPTVSVKDEVYEWIKQLCMEQTFEEVAITKKLISLCLYLSHQHKDQTKILYDIAFDAHYHLGDIEAENSVSRRQTYNVINERTSPSVIQLVLHHIEQILDEIEWVLITLNADATFIKRSLIHKTSHQSKNEMKEGSVCKIMLEIIKVFHELLQTAVPVNLCNVVLKATTTSYKCLTLLCKYYISLYDQKTGHLHPMFEKTVKFSGTQLTTQVYSFMIYNQNVESDTTSKKKTKLDSSAKAVREQKTYAALVFAIELYERQIIILSKKSKNNLASYMKLSTARDFRIDATAVKAAMEQGEEAVNDNDSDHSASSCSTLPLPENQTSSKRKGEGKSLSKVKRRCKK